MFNVKTLNETKQLIKKHFSNHQVESVVINTTKSKGMVLASDIYAREDIPHFDRSTVDGYAVISESVMQASSSSPVMLEYIGESNMGKECKLSIKNNTTVYVPTGGHVPENTTGVVMIEDTELLKNNVMIYKGVRPYQNMFLKGTDVKKDSLVLIKNTIITDTIVGLLKAQGIKQIEVYKPLSIMVISTGDEITDNDKLLIGEVRDINTHTISSFLSPYHVDIKETHLIQDDFKSYFNTVKKGLEQYDIVISSGGSSVGEKDYTINVLEELNAEVFVYGINIKPGKPTILAKHNDHAFIGLPGQPTSAYIVLNELFKTFFNAIHNLKTTPTPYIEGLLTMSVHAKQGRKLFQMVSIEEKDNNILVTPLLAKSGMIKLLSSSYGYITLEDNQEGLDKGTNVKVYRFGD